MGVRRDGEDIKGGFLAVNSELTQKVEWALAKHKHGASALAGE